MFYGDPLTYTFALIPADGDIVGAPNSTIGWGYTLQNQDTTDWLVVTTLNAAPFLFATPEASVFDFPILAPGADLSVPFDPIAMTGLYGLTWDQNVANGFVNNGLFVLTLDWWSDDPFAGGIFLQSAPDATASYSATAVPEPSTAALCTVLVLMVKMRKRLWRLSGIYKLFESSSTGVP
jgi:hypothetical protein